MTIPQDPSSRLQDLLGNPDIKGDARLEKDILGQAKASITLTSGRSLSVQTTHGGLIQYLRGNDAFKQEAEKWLQNSAAHLIDTFANQESLSSINYSSTEHTFTTIPLSGKPTTVRVSELASLRDPAFIETQQKALGSNRDVKRIREVEKQLENIPPENTGKRRKLENEKSKLERSPGIQAMKQFELRQTALKTIEVAGPYFESELSTQSSVRPVQESFLNQSKENLAKLDLKNFTSKQIKETPFDHPLFDSTLMEAIPWETLFSNPENIAKISLEKFVEGTSGVAQKELGKRLSTLIDKGKIPLEDLPWKDSKFEKIIGSLDHKIVRKAIKENILPDKLSHKYVDSGIEDLKNGFSQKDISLVKDACEKLSLTPSKKIAEVIRTFNTILEILYDRLDNHPLEDLREGIPYLQEKLANFSNLKQEERQVLLQFIAELTYDIGYDTAYFDTNMHMEFHGAISVEERFMRAEPLAKELWIHSHSEAIKAKFYTEFLASALGNPTDVIIQTKDSPEIYKRGNSSIYELDIKTLKEYVLSTDDAKGDFFHLSKRFEEDAYRSTINLPDQSTLQKTADQTRPHFALLVHQEFERILTKNHAELAEMSITQTVMAPSMLLLTKYVPQMKMEGASIDTVPAEITSELPIEIIESEDKFYTTYGKAFRFFDSSSLRPKFAYVENVLVIDKKTGKESYYVLDSGPLDSPDNFDGTVALNVRILAKENSDLLKVLQTKF